MKPCASLDSVIRSGLEQASRGGYMTSRLPQPPHGLERRRGSARPGPSRVLPGVPARLASRDCALMERSFGELSRLARGA